MIDRPGFKKGSHGGYPEYGWVIIRETTWDEIRFIPVEDVWRQQYNRTKKSRIFEPRISVFQLSYGSRKWGMRGKDHKWNNWPWLEYNQQSLEPSWILKWYEFITPGEFERSEHQTLIDCRDVLRGPVHDFTQIPWLLMALHGVDRSVPTKL
jgi:hypothetical protein